MCCGVISFLVSLFPWQSETQGAEIKVVSSIIVCVEIMYLFWSRKKDKSACLHGVFVILVTCHTVLKIHQFFWEIFMLCVTETGTWLFLSVIYTSLTYPCDGAQHWNLQQLGTRSGTLDVCSVVVISYLKYSYSQWNAYKTITRFKTHLEKWNLCIFLSL
jgi:hypothetical protein